MKVTIYYKSDLGDPTTTTYDLDQKEFTRLADDFSAYLKDGTPKTGLYRSNKGEVKAGVKRTKLHSVHRR